MARFVPSTRRRGDGRMRVILTTIEVMMGSELLSPAHYDSLLFFRNQLRKRLSR